jgi:hypothetical protein
MATNAQKQEMAIKAKKDLSALRVAWVALILFLAISVVLNVISSLFRGFDPVALGIAGLPPMSLFVVSLLLERLETDWVVKTLLAVTVLVSLAFSWYHIAMVGLHYAEPWPIAWTFPLILDVPMLLAGRSIMIIRSRKPVQLPQPVQTVTKATVPAKRTTRTKVVTVTP